MPKRPLFKDRTITFSWKGYLELCLTAAPMVLSIAMLLWWSEPSPTVVSALSFFVAGITGLIIIARRKIPVAIYTITGTRAVVEGIILTIVCWGIALYVWLQGL